MSVVSVELTGSPRPLQYEVSVCVYCTRDSEDGWVDGWNIYMGGDSGKCLTLLVVLFLFCFLGQDIATNCKLEIFNQRDVDKEYSYYNCIIMLIMVFRSYCKLASATILSIISCTVKG